ncbi:uncharacterized protein LOC143465094 isoform X2 [Clavelina lepadiformis]|uniref:uncharacterized protein LOC143465094 isoform X2 n=1 Tax=Clavelina lepadiformis TaxID=159417 RepID=UPI004042A1E3
MWLRFKVSSLSLQQTRRSRKVAPQQFQAASESTISKHGPTDPLQSNQRNVVNPSAGSELVEAGDAGKTYQPSILDEVVGCVEDMILSVVTAERFEASYLKERKSSSGDVKSDMESINAAVNECVEHLIETVSKNCDLNAKVEDKSFVPCKIIATSDVTSNITCLAELTNSQLTSLEDNSTSETAELDVTDQFPECGEIRSADEIVSSPASLDAMSDHQLVFCTNVSSTPGCVVAGGSGAGHVDLVPRNVLNKPTLPDMKKKRNKANLGSFVENLLSCCFPWRNRNSRNRSKCS